MRFVVTGGDGFIGSALAKSLVMDHHEVVVIDNHLTSALGVDHPRVTRIIGDVIDPHVRVSGPVDGVFHLASVAAPNVYMTNPALVLGPNLTGTQHMCDLAQRSNCPILFASTSEVYGHSAAAPGAGAGLSEDEPALVGLLTQRSVYGAAKRAGEEIVLAHRRAGGRGTSVRIFNTYGPGLDRQNLDDGRVLRVFFEAARRRLPFPIHGDGEQTRSFLWVDECVAALRLLMEAETLPPAVNVGHPTPVSINDLVAKVGASLGFQPDVARLPARPDEPRHRYPNLELMTSLTEWAPRIGLEDGLGRMAQGLQVRVA